MRAQNPLAQRDPRLLALSVTTIGSFMSILDGTIVNIALPDIMKELHAGLDSGQFVLTIYLVSLAIVIPLSGYLGERIGMKRLYLITLAMFTAGSALCGFAWNLPSLIAFRALQGLGGGMLQPLGMAIVFTLITPLERGRFMGLLGLPLLLAPIIGPTLGGYLVEYSTWRMIFWINLPIGLINFILAARLLQETPIHTGLRLDRVGLVLAAVGLPLLLFGLSQGETAGWGSPVVLGTITVGLAMLILLVRVELRRPFALLQVGLFRSLDFTVAAVVLFSTQFALFGMQFLLPLFLQSARHLSPAKTGLVMLPGGIVTFAALTYGGRMYNRLGPKPLAISGMIVLLGSTLYLSRMTETTSIILIAGAACTRGIGMGLCMMPVQTAAYNTIAQDAVPRATATIQTLFRVFGSLSTATLTAVLVFSLGWHGAPSGASITDTGLPLPVMAKAFDDAFLVLAGVVVLGLILCFRLKDNVLVNLRREGKAPERVLDEA